MRDQDAARVFLSMIDVAQQRNMNMMIDSPDVHNGSPVLRDRIGMNALKLCLLRDLKPEQPLQVVLPGHEPFAVFRVEDEIYVTDDFCTHGKASLSDEGELDGFKILCTWHDGAFDIRTGEVLARPCTEKLRTYKVTIEDDAVFIDCS
jgi:nitrite reductase/ring-hydroxylating ferredoxin subunit